MKKILHTVLAASLCAAGPSFAQENLAERAPWNNAADGPEGSVVAFVGEKIFVEERNLEQTMEVKLPDGQTVTRTIPNFDHRYEARYKILEKIAGDYTAPAIDFVAFNHYGRPYFPKVNPVLLFAVNYDGRWIHSKYLFYEVHRTTDGDWAICGMAVNSNASEARQTLASNYEEPIGFLNPVKTHEGAPCVSGTRASNLFAFQNRTRFAPRRHRVACNREMGEPDNLYIGPGSSAPDTELKAKLHAACVQRLEAEVNL